MTSTSDSLNLLSSEWHNSQTAPGVKFAIRRITLAARIELARRARDLSAQSEYLRTGDSTDRLDAALGELLVDKLYVDWGLAEIRGLIVDGSAVKASEAADKAPERLTREIVDTVRSYLVLSDEERKNF